MLIHVDNIMHMKSENVINVFIPMKGHSERVPNKNLKLFNGAPLYHKIVNVVRACPYVDKIAVDTDSSKIKKDIEKNFPDITIIDRPDKLCGDFTSMNDVIAHDLSILDGNDFLQTHSTNPLLTTSTLNKAVEFYFKHRNTYDSIFSVTKLRTRLYWEDGKPINHDPDNLIRTQELSPVYEENSNFYLFSRTSFKNSGGKRIGLKPFMFKIPKLEAMDIDEPIDFLVAEELNKIQLNSQ